MITPGPKCDFCGRASAIRRSFIADTRSVASDPVLDAPLVTSSLNLCSSCDTRLTDWRRMYPYLQH